MDIKSTEDDPLQAALATAFTDSPILSPRSSAATSNLQPPDQEPGQEQAEEGGGDEAWKEEYEQHLSHWRAESAAAREKAEQERERWRLIREREQEQEKEQQAAEGNRQQGMHVGGVQRNYFDWETVTNSSNIPASAPMHAEGGGRLSDAEQVSAVQDTPPRYSTLVTGVKDLVTGEMPREPAADPIETPATATTPPSNTDDHGLSSSRTWEEVPSVDSSMPSLSFPERSAAASPDPRERPLYQESPAAPSVTLAIFDSSLSRRTRMLALISSLAINMFLPFVNGVMLGFGEIFAKNVVGFFGWNLPSTAVGVRAAPRKR